MLAPSATGAGNTAAFPRTSPSPSSPSAALSRLASRRAGCRCVSSTTAAAACSSTDLRKAMEARTSAHTGSKLSCYSLVSAAPRTPSHPAIACKVLAVASWSHRDSGRGPQGTRTLSDSESNLASSESQTISSFPCVPSLPLPLPLPPSPSPSLEPFDAPTASHGSPPCRPKHQASSPACHGLRCNAMLQYETSPPATVSAQCITAAAIASRRACLASDATGVVALP